MFNLWSDLTKGHDHVFYKAIWKKGWTVGQSQLFGMLTKHWASEKLPSSDKSLEQIVLQSSREDKNRATPYSIREENMMCSGFTVSETILFFSCFFSL